MKVPEEQLIPWPLLTTQIGGPFIVDWQISRPLPTPPDGVAEAPYIGLDDRDAEWKPSNIEPDAAFVIVHGQSGESDGLVYLAHHLDIEKAGEWELALGHDGPAAMFVDGNRVLTEPQSINPARPARSCAVVDLAQGRHEVVVAFDLAGGMGWGIYFQVCRAECQYGETARRYGISTGVNPIAKPKVKQAIVPPYGESSVDVKLSEPNAVFVAPKPEGSYGWGVYGCPSMYLTTDSDIIVHDRGISDSYDWKTFKVADEICFKSTDKGMTWGKANADEVEAEPFCFLLPDGSQLLFRYKMPAVDTHHTGSVTGKEWLNLHELGVKPVDTVMMSNNAALHGLFKYGDIPAEARKFEVLSRGRNEKEWKVDEGSIDYPDWLLSACIKMPRPPYWWPDLEPVINPMKFFRDARLLDAMVEIEDGTLLCPIDVASPKDGRYFEEVHCMASTDKGKTWQRRGVMANQTDLGVFGFTEEFSMIDAGGELVCVIRTDHCTLDPDNDTMATMLTRSTDNGFTWSYPQPVASSSVTPSLIKLENGVVALVFGRPGVHVQFSTDGCKTWNTLTSIIGKTKEEELNAGRKLMDAMYNETVSYSNTRAIITGPDRFLVLYPDFTHRGEDGQLHRSIKVMEVVASPK